MPKLISRLFLIVVGTCGIAQNSFAGTYLKRTGIEIQADDGAIAVMLVNGIRNDKTQVEESSEALIQSLKANGIAQGTYTFGYYRNPTDGLLGDTGEVAHQQRISDNYLTVSGGDRMRYYSLLGADYNDKCSAVTSLTGVEKRVVSFACQLKRNIVYTLTTDGSHTASRGMVLVPHSQGNMYAEAAYAMLVADGNAEVLSRLRIVGVAVASATTPSSRYITHESDTIVGTASAEVALAVWQSLTFRPLSANQVACSSVLGIPFCGDGPYWAAIDPLQHGFTEVYLNPAISSQATGDSFPSLIYELVTASIAALVEPPPPPIATGSLAAGAEHTCALTASGGVKCWGSNAQGQLGDGSFTNSPIPVNVLGLTTGVVAISAGHYHTCALTTAGAVKCWGFNYVGALGDGTQTNRPAPVDVVSLGSGVTSISAGASHTCAVTATGQAKCWGGNAYGQLGNGDVFGLNVNTPVEVALLSNARTVVASALHSCAVTVAGGAKCWGSNGNAALGDGTGVDRLLPVDVMGLTSGVRSIASKGGHVCAVTIAGAAKCWGDNTNGRLGDGTEIRRLSPVDVIGLGAGVASIDAWPQSCVVTTAGAVMCWGPNAQGSLGDGTTTDRFTPVATVGLGVGVTDVVIGGGHTCARTTNGSIKCWGLNTRGQVGDGTGTTRLTPVAVLGF